MTENAVNRGDPISEPRDEYRQHPQDGKDIDQPTSFALNNSQMNSYLNHGIPPYSQNYSNHVVPNPDADLSAQMYGLDITETPAVKRKKIKDRHAYHQIGPTDSTGTINQASQVASLYFNTNNPNQAETPSFNSSQFPSPANNLFTPDNPVSATEFASRSHTPQDKSSSNVQTLSQGRVDPDHIPSIPRSRELLAEHYLNHIYPTFEYHLPPPVTVSFVAHDQGNASPKFARLTMSNIPSTSDALKSTGLPLGLLLQPLAPLRAGELEIPVLDFGDAGPPRCQRCRAYINPFMVFRSGGNKFVCNMCNYANDVSLEYFSALTPQGARVDREQRPELLRGTVEFLVPKEYWSKQPMKMHWLFLIDVSQEALNSGFLEGVCRGIMAALYGIGEDISQETKMQRRLPLGSKVGIVTYDKDVQFYNLNPALSEAQMLLTSDIDDPFVPLNEGLFVDPYDAMSNISSLLDRLPSLFSKIKNPEPALLPTLNAALAALEKTGGKIICSLAKLPTWGPGRLFLRDDGKQHDGDTEKKLFGTEHPGWKKVAEKFTHNGIGVDFFLAAPASGYLDIATIGYVSAFTGGETFYYPNFASPRDTEKLMKEILHTVTRETGYQALMKVRCSNGLQVSSYTGNFCENTYGSDIEFGVIDQDKSIGVMFKYDGKLDGKLDAHFQSALLYTTSNGERRVRCSNVIASVSDNAKGCMKYIDQDAVYTLIAKEAASKMISTPLKEIRGALSEKTIDILAGYRKGFSGSYPPGQLVLPENLKEFSMYILGLIKSRAFKGGHEPSDRRVHDMRMLKSMSASELSFYLYPRIIPIHNLAPQDGFPDEQGHLRMPTSIRCSFSRIEVGGVYLVDNGQNCYLWMHSQTSPNLLLDLFGEGKDSLKNLDPQCSSIPVLQTHLNAQVRNILEYLKIMRGSKALTIQIARQGIDSAEYDFARLLVEDRNNEAQNYVDWLVHIHRYVQLELTGQRIKEDGDSSIASNFAGLRPPYW